MPVHRHKKDTTATPPGGAPGANHPTAARPADVPAVWSSTNLTVIMTR